MNRKNFLSRIAAFFLSFALLFVTFGANAQAADYKYISNDEVSIKIVDFSNQSVLYISRIEAQTTDAVKVIYDGLDVVACLGWYDISETDVLKDETADFTVKVVNGVVYLEERNQEPVSVGNINNIGWDSFRYVTARAGEWGKMEVARGNLKTDVSTVAQGVAILAGVFGSGGGAALAEVAQIIINYSIKETYYIKYLYSKILDPCTQTYYYSYAWYSDAGYSNLIGVTNTAQQTVNIC